MNHPFRLDSGIVLNLDHVVLVSGPNPAQLARVILINVAEGISLRPSEHQRLMEAIFGR